MTTLTIPDSPKEIRETVYAAQLALAEQQLGDRRREHIARLGRVADAALTTTATEE